MTPKYDYFFENMLHYVNLTPTTGPKTTRPLGLLHISPNLTQPGFLEICSLCLNWWATPLTPLKTPSTKTLA